MKWLDTVAGTIILGGICFFIIGLAGMIFVPWITLPLIGLAAVAGIGFMIYLFIRGCILLWQDR